MMKLFNIVILLVLHNRYLYELTSANSCDVNTFRYHNVTADIHIIGFFPCTDPNDTRGIPVDNCDGIERIPIMKLALEEINERCDLLPGYRLVVDYANSAVSWKVVCLIPYNSRSAAVLINSSNISSYPTN